MKTETATSSTGAPESLRRSPARATPPGRKRHAWRKFVSPLIAVFLVALIVRGLWPKPIAVELVKVSRGPLVVSVLEEGKTRVRDRFVIASPVSGMLQRVELEEGDPVEAGKTVVARIQAGVSGFLEPRERMQGEARVQGALAAVSRQQEAIQRAQAELDLAQKDMKRAEELVREGAMSKKDWDMAESAVQVKTRDLRAAEFALSVAKYDLEQGRALLLQGTESNESAAPPLELRSPVNGQVLNLYQESLRVVPAGTPIMEVGDPRAIEVEAEILSQDAVSIHPGSDVWVEAWGGEKPIRAKVRIVEPAAFTKISALGVEEQRVRVIADFTDPLPQDQLLGDRYRIETRVVTWQGEDVAKIPTGALFRRGNDWMTFVLDGGKARLRKLELGHSNGVEAEVKNGLTVGESVVLHPPDTISDGTSIIPRS